MKKIQGRLPNKLSERIQNSKHSQSCSWTSVETRRKFLDEIATKFNITSPSDWGKITTRQFYEISRSSFLKRYYNDSLFECLRSLYTDIDWKMEWFSTFPKFYWESVENHKKFLDQVALQLNIKNPSDWGKVTQHDIIELGGSSLLTRYYNSSLFRCLQSVYSDVDWKMEWFSKTSQSYWKSTENRKKFLDNMATKLNIKKPSDWGKVTRKDIHENRGSFLLNYGSSIFASLQATYRDIHWKREWFSSTPRYPKSYWNSQENCKLFVEEVAKKNQIRNESEWRKVTVSILRKNGGSELLRKYEGSIQSLLNHLYPRSNWDLLASPKAPSGELQLQGLIERTFPSEAILLNHRKLASLS